VSEQGGQHAARIAASGRIAELLGADVSCGKAATETSCRAVRLALDELPSRLAREVGEWQERVRQNGWQLDTEEWMLGLLTLSCLDSNA
jgi:hypothetical protein